MTDNLGIVLDALGREGRICRAGVQKLHITFFCECDGDVPIYFEAEPTDMIILPCHKCGRSYVVSVAELFGVRSVSMTPTEAKK